MAIFGDYMAADNAQTMSCCDSHYLILESSLLTLNHWNVQWPTVYIPVQSQSSAAYIAAACACIARLDRTYMHTQSADRQALDGSQLDASVVVTKACT